jgi:hypothetical protein
MLKILFLFKTERYIRIPQVDKVPADGLEIRERRFDSRFSVTEVAKL